MTALIKTNTVHNGPEKSMILIPYATTCHQNLRMFESRFAVRGVLRKRQPPSMTDAGGCLHPLDVRSPNQLGSSLQSFIQQ
jgi:hypothetical protein